MTANGQFYAAAAAVILDEAGRVLLTQRSLAREHHPGEWEIPTGRLQAGETFEAALHREVKEELGIEIALLRPLGTFHFYRGTDRAEHIGVRFVCAIRSGVPIVDGIEEVAFQWLSLPEAIQLVKDQSIKDGLQEALLLTQPS